LDYLHWIISNCAYANQLKPETIEVISNFTLLWSFFEGALCNRRASVKAFEDLAKKIAQYATNVEKLEGIEVVLAFWRFRYWTGSEFNGRFKGLEFRQGDRQDIVEAVLRKEKRDFNSQLLAVMIIVYRLRNNLFHGLKTIDMLNDQALNLDMACKALATVLEVSGNHLLKSQSQLMSAVK
jgi:hypothetical protein